jgi:hypothetical protein
MKILYIGHDRTEPDYYCPGSTVCISLVEKLSQRVRVQNCDILRQHEDLPEWLNGTPILIDEEEQHPHRGTEAVRYLQQMLKQEEKMTFEATERNREPTAPPASKPVIHAPPRMEPQQTRQPSSRPRTQARESSKIEVESAMMEDEEEDTAQDATANGNVNTLNSNVPLGNGKINDDDLQRFMEARKNSPASSSPQQPTQ